MVESVKHISPIEWDRNSEENSMDEINQGPNNDIKEIQRLCTQSSPQLDNNYRLPSKIKYLFLESRYFMIKSNNFENVSLAKVRNVWSTTRANEVRLNKAFYETKNVLLIFSVKESGKFQGYARLATASNPKKHINWVLPSHMNQRQLSGVFQIDWLSREDVPFSKTNHLVNAWNEHKPVKIGRDGQEIEPSCGEFLCRLFPVDSDCLLNEIIEKAKSGPTEYRENNRSSNNTVSSSLQKRTQDHYNPKLLNSYDVYGSSSYNDQTYRTSEYRQSPSHSKRGKDEYLEPSRSRDDYQHENSDVFLNGNYEEYLREQTSYNRTYNQCSYEQRVDDFLRNIVKREPPLKNHDDSSDYSQCSSNSVKRRKPYRSRSYDRQSKGRSTDRRSIERRLNDNKRSTNTRNDDRRSKERRTKEERCDDKRSSKYHSKRYRSGSKHRR